MLITRIVLSTYLPSLYIPDRPFSAPTAPIRVLSIQDGKKVEKDLKGVEAFTSPNYVTGLAAALLSKVSIWISNLHPHPVSISRLSSTSHSWMTYDRRFIPAHFSFQNKKSSGGSRADCIARTPLRPQSERIPDPPSTPPILDPRHRTPQRPFPTLPF